MSASVAIRFNAITGEAEKAFSSLTRTVSGFEKSFAGVASSVQGHQERMNRAFEQFSGDKLLREANELARAIEKVGGASKLTATEQQHVNRVVTEAIAKYQALGLTAPKSLLDLANATKQVEVATKQLEAPIQKASAFAGVLGSAFGQFTLANLAATAISKVVGSLTDFVAQGAKLPGLERSFETLNASIGQSSAGMLSTLQQSTRGLVSNFDLMQSANKAVLLGLPVTEKEMGELARSATALGRAMGLDATQSLNDLIVALGRSSPLILDNLGLTVKVGEANEAYAAKLGKTSDALTDAEKKTAFYEAAMEAARKKTDELGEQSLTLSERIGRLWTTVENSATRAVSNINVVLGKATESWGEFFEFIKRSAQFQDFEKQRRDLEALAEAAAAANAPAKRKRTPGGSQDFLFEELQRDAEAAAKPLAALSEVQRKLAIQFLEGGKSAQFIADKLNAVTATAGVSERQIQKLADGMRTSEREANSYQTALKKITDGLSGAKLAGEVKKLHAAFGALNTEQRQSSVVLNHVADAALELFKSGAKLTPELFNIIIEAGKLSELLPPVKVGLDGTAGAFQNVTGDVKASAAALIEFNEIMNSLKFVEGVPSNIPGFSFKPTIPEPLDPTFWDHFFDVKGPTLAESARFAADSAIGALANAITTGDWASFRTALRNTFAEFAGSAIAAGVNLLVPGLGTLLQPLFSALADKFIGLFDRNRGRDLVEDFAQSLGGFDALHRKLNELGDEGERLWIQLTQGVGRNNPDQARRAIEAVTAALDEQKRKQQEAAQASVETSKKIQDTQNAAADVLRGRIAELSSEYDRLFNSIKDEAPEEVMGIIEQQTRARMAAVREEQTATQTELDKLLKSLEDSFAAVGEAAQAAAQTIQDAFNGIHINPIDIGFPSGSGGTVDVPAMAHGGIVRRPTLALVGESVPEAVIPLSSFGGGGQAPMTVIIEANGQPLAELVVPYIPGVVKRFGLV